MNPEPIHIEEHLLLQYLTGRAGADERAAVEAWLEESEAHRKTLDRLEHLWLETGRLNPPPLAVDTDAAWNRMLFRMNAGETVVANERGIRPFVRYALRIAAALVILAGIVALIRWWTAKPAMIEMAATEMVLRDTLPDGSRITLNSDSRLVFPEKFRSDSRRVKLTGEAYFNVVRDSLRPFIIDAGAAGVKVLGTSFRVKTRPGEAVEVHVVSGRVLLFRIDPRTEDTLSLVLTSGEQGVMKPGARTPEKKEGRISDDLFWANRMLEFEGIPLSEVIGLLEKHYGIAVTVSTPDILYCRLSATFLDDPPGRIMTVIAESFGLQLSTKGNNYQLSGNGCSKGVE